MALILALSYSGKFQSIELVAQNDSVFFWEPDVAVHYHRAACGVVIGLQDLNDVLVANTLFWQQRGAEGGAPARPVRGSSEDHGHVGGTDIVGDAPRDLEIHGRIMEWQVAAV